MLRHWRALALGCLVLPAAFWAGGWLALETGVLFYPFLIRKTLAGFIVTAAAHHVALGVLTMFAIVLRDPTLGR